MRSSANRCSLFHRLGCTLLLCGLTSAVVGAQGAVRPGGRDVAILTLSGLTAVDDNGGVQEVVDVRDPQYQNVQVYSVLSAAVLLNPQHEKVQWFLGASTGVRHYASLHEFSPSGQTLSAGLSFPLDGRTTVSLSESASYSPTYSLTPFFAGAQPQFGGAPGQFGGTQAQFGGPQGQFGLDALPAGLDYGVARSPNFYTSTSLSISRSLTARGSVSAAYTLNRMAFTSSNETAPNLSSSNASARFTYRLTRDASVHAGYGRRLGQYDFVFGEQNARVDDYDFGVDYSRALSLRPSRQTTLTFATGSSIYRDFGGRHYAFTGSANLMRRFGRRNQFDLNYSRGLGFYQGLLTPVFTDTVSANGLFALSRRLRLSSSMGYVFGNVINNIESHTRQDNYGAWIGTGQFAMMLTQRAWLEAGYTYYQHNVGDAVQLLGNLPSRQHRQMLYVGLSVGVPLLTERSRTRR